MSTQTVTIPAADYRAQIAADMKEATLQTQIERLARTLGWRIYHTHDSRRSNPGFPDLVLVHARQRRVLWRELKTQKGRVRPEQRAWLDDLTAAGEDAAIWRPSDLIEGRVAQELSDREEVAA